MSSPIECGVNGRTAGEGYGRKTRGQGTEESHIGIKERGNGTCESPEQGWGTIGGGRGGKADDQGERQPTTHVLDSERGESQAGPYGVTERLVVPMRPGNAGGGKGPQCNKRRRQRDWR